MAGRKTSASTTEIGGSCLAAKARLVGRVVTSIYDDAFRPLGAKVSQLNILVLTQHLGVARPAVVCEMLHLDTSTLSRNVERMRKKGWLEIVPAPGRSQPFQLTAEGRALIRKAEPAWQEAQETAKKILGKELVQALSKPMAELCCGARGN
ncbi:MAG: MarR family winged helix-turn-helix transcriptional regulator [Fuerstiella sp.]